METVQERLPVPADTLEEELVQLVLHFLALEDIKRERRGKHNQSEGVRLWQEEKRRFDVLRTALMMVGGGVPAEKARAYRALTGARHA